LMPPHSAITYRLRLLDSLVGHLGGGEVEVAEGLGPHHQDMGEVGLGSDPIDHGGGLSSDNVEGLRVEAGVYQSHLGGGTAAHVEDGVAYQQVALLHQVLVQDLLRDQETGTGLVFRQAGAKHRAQGEQSQQVLEHSTITDNMKFYFHVSLFC